MDKELEVQTVIINSQHRFRVAGLIISSDMSLDNTDGLSIQILYSSKSTNITLLKYSVTDKSPALKI